MAVQGKDGNATHPARTSNAVRGDPSRRVACHQRTHVRSCPALVSSCPLPASRMRPATPQPVRPLPAAARRTSLDFRCRSRCGKGISIPCSWNALEVGVPKTREPSASRKRAGKSGKRRVNIATESRIGVALRRPGTFRDRRWRSARGARGTLPPSPRGLPTPAPVVPTDRTPQAC